MGTTSKKAMVSNSTSLGFAFGCWIIMNLIILPHDIYWCYKFWQERKELIIKKREPVLVIVYAAAVSVYIFLNNTTLIVRYEIEEYNESEKARDTFTEIYLIAFVPFLWTAWLLSLVRYWIIFYKISHNAAVMNDKWQSVLDPNMGKQNWYLQNVNKWGSLKYVQKWVIIYGIICYISSIIPYFIDNDETGGGAAVGFVIFVVCCNVIPAVFCIFMLLKIPPYKDDIGIRTELKHCIHLLIANVALFGIFYTYYNYQTLSLGIKASSNIAHIQFYCFHLFSKILASAITLRSTRSVLKTFDEIINGRFSHSASINMMAMVHKETIAEQDRVDSQSMVNSEATRVRREIKSVMINEALFDAFMDNLFSEYCAECLLSIVEFIQFRNRIKNDFEKEIEFKEDEEIKIELYSGMVKSKIVYDGDDYKEIALQLYRKYIRVGSEWEININYRERNRYKQLFEVDGISLDDKQKLYTLFDSCIKQMLGLLSGVFTRFKNSDQYKLIIHHSPRNETDVAWSE